MLKSINRKNHKLSHALNVADDGESHAASLGRYTLSARHRIQHAREAQSAKDRCDRHIPLSWLHPKGYPEIRLFSASSQERIETLSKNPRLPKTTLTFP